MTTAIEALPSADESTPGMSNDPEVQMSQSPAGNATEVSKSGLSNGKGSRVEMLKAKVKSMTGKKSKTENKPTSEKHVRENEDGELGSKTTSGRFGLCTIQ